MKGKKNLIKKQTQDKNENLDQENLKLEIEKYLKITEEINNFEKVDPKEEAALKLQQDTRQTQIKGLIEIKDYEQLYEHTMQLVIKFLYFINNFNIFTFYRI